MLLSLFSPAIRFEDGGIVLGTERLPFAGITDARVDGSFLVLVSPAGERRVRVRRAHAMTLLDVVLEGITRAHPADPYRSTEGRSIEEAPLEPGRRRSQLRRPRASLGSPDLWVGRTLYR